MNISKKNLHQIIFWIMGGTLLSYSTYRAIHIPITVDEGTTFLVYAQNSLKDVFLNNPVNTNNHFLNTFLIKLSTWILGDSQFSVRLPSLLGHLLYIIFSFKLLQAISARTIVIISGIALLHFNPYFIDFFGLARGYSLSWGFMMGSMYYLYRYIEARKTKFISWSFILAGLSVYSILISLNYFLALIVAFNIIFLLEFFSKSSRSNFILHFLRKNTPAILSSVVLFAFLAYPISQVRANNEFYGERGSFLNDSILSIVNQSLFGKRYFGSDFPDVLIGLAIIVFIAVLIFSIVKLITKKITSYSKTENILIGGLTFSTLFTIACWSTIAQFYLLETPYLSGRTALIFVPLFSILPVFFFTFFQEKKWIQLVLCIVPLFAYSFHLSKTANLNSVREWWFDTNNIDVLNYFLEKEKIDTKVTFGISGLNSPSFHFYEKVWNLEDKVEMIRRDQLAKEEYFDYYYIEKHYMNQISEERYEIMKQFDSRVLLKLKPNSSN